MSNSSQSLRVMADYDCYPLWRTGADGLSNLSPEDPVLGLTAELANSLHEWAAEYDATLDRRDPASSGFPSESEEQDFVKRGEVLAQHVKRELMDGWQVRYFDLKLRVEKEV